jgi:hypothetical protein
MSDSNIVVACHCKVHKQLYHVKADGKRGHPLGNGAIYIDPHVCPENPWSSVKEASIDYVWGENCSVYMQLTHGLQIIKKGKTVDLKNSRNDEESASQVLFRILNESFRVLKEGGRVIFGEVNEIPGSLKEKEALINAHPEISPRYSVEIVPALGYDLHLAQHLSRKLLPKSFLYVFTKKPTSKSGGRHTRRYRENRNKTRKYKSK